MLPLPNLNDQDKDEILETAMYGLAQNGSQWQDLEVHDPGVTFLELLISLKVEQQKSIDKIGARSLDKFLKWLQIEAPKASAARTTVLAEPKVGLKLPKGTRLEAHGLSFVVDKTTEISPNKILALKNQECGVDRRYFYEKNNLKRNIPIFGEPTLEDLDLGVTQEFQIAFEAGFDNENVSLYVALQNSARRNPVLDVEDFVPLGKNIWQYYGEKDGSVGWQNMEVVSDETQGLLFSGSIILVVDGKMKAVDGEYLFKITNLEYGYEVPPILRYIALNPVPLVQKDVLAGVEEFTLEQFVDNNMYFWSDLAKNNKARLYIKSGSGFVLAEDLGVLFQMQRQEAGNFRLGTSKREELYESFGDIDGEDVVLRLVMYDLGFWQHEVLGSSPGTSFLELDIRDKVNLLDEKFEIMVKSPVGWEVWQQVDTLDAAKSGDKVYFLNAQRGVLRFGDNKTGKVPSIGLNNIVVTSMACTKGSAANLQSGILENFQREEFDDVDIFQFMEASGGRDAATVAEKLSLVEKVLTERHSAVTAADYEALALMSPALLLENVTVIPLYKPGLKNYPADSVANAVTLLIEPYGMSQNPNVLAAYKANVAGHMEKYRLLGTRLYVETPNYVPMSLEGEIIIKKRSNVSPAEAKLKIAEIVKEYVTKVQKNNLEITLYYALIHSAIEELSFVAEVDYLILDVPEDSHSKNQFGDIKISPNSRIYLEKNNISISVK